MWLLMLVCQEARLTFRQLLVISQPHCGMSCAYVVADAGVSGSTSHVPPVADRLHTTARCTGKETWQLCREVPALL